MTRPEMSDHALDALFDAAQDAPDVDPDFLARLSAEAETALRPVALRVPQKESWRASLGGWFGMGSLVVATCAGVWIGLSPPEFLPDPAAILSGDIEAQFVDFYTLPFDGLDLEES